jgi:hypothetical protein
VFGLQRAFHLAGARDVVATLWKVDDDATAALMALFYHSLWEQNLPPIQALRRAQLAVYRHPEQIRLWSQGRGIDPARIVPGLAGPAEGDEPASRAHPKLWAAFTLSGLGFSPDQPLVPDDGADADLLADQRLEGSDSGTRPPANWSRWPWVTGGAAAVVLLTAAVWRWRRTSARPSSEPTANPASRAPQGP